jgi:formylglycine-generating enzyme required for sulfatase activity
MLQRIVVKLTVKRYLLLMSAMLLTASLSACHDKAKQTQQLVQHSLNDMTFVKGGTYAMGYGNTKPDTTVKSFYISKYNVSYTKYDSYMAILDKPLVNKKFKGDFFRNSVHPVDDLTWYQANDYCQYLAKKTGLPYDLPTAAQWEYVARNGGKLHWDFPTNNGKQELGKNFPNQKQYASQQGNVIGETLPLPVGSLPCTPMGICGLTGEVVEWLKNRNDKNQHLASGGIGSPSMEHAYNIEYVNSDWQQAGFRCVINSDKPMSELKQQALQQ